jgi:DNA repair exonuclease SbcCD ATPase subunit
MDWRAKYLEVADVLADTRNELDDFHHSSKELEEELERELERAEKAQKDLKHKVSRAESERDEWKVCACVYAISVQAQAAHDDGPLPQAKFMSLQTTHNTTTTSLQRELDMLRQELQKVKIRLRDLEMGNDDLERNERAVSASLADTESKYSRALEEKILLEHELLDKAGLEEECQRLKDELRGGCPDPHVRTPDRRRPVLQTRTKRSRSLKNKPTTAPRPSRAPRRPRPRPPRARSRT